ncbi:Cyclic di-GMP phosphodiesterase response regulator RpfG [Sporomusa ovata DSM 2662]|uniref:Adenylate/guanylate cyclase n=1 Tax=Sporomusa ovata TaxID=2378 RepID=A0A0U1KSC0_9FIRM|nr:HD domain-containing phosphohydrolase [Sporomusa ovata]EQB26242.1 cyclic di-GMP phosphodiesterase response regulator RpfG [Sporomusa ovata DSM 2662]CQR70318.1 Adenylate/guanylate cyclase [Sporomusa ovata]
MDRVGQYLRNWIIPDRSIILFCAVLLVFVWSGAWWQIAHDHKATIDMIHQDGDRLARAFEEHVRRVLKTNEFYLNSMKAEYEQTYTLSPALERVFRQLRLDPTASAGVVNSTGDFVISTLGNTAGVNIAAVPHFIYHIAADTGESYLGRPFVGRTSQKVSIHMTRRLNNPDGSFAGVAIIAMDPYYFTKFYRAMDFTENYSIRLIGFDGIVRASNDVSELDADMSESSLLRQIKNVSDGFYSTYDYISGRPLEVSYHTMPDYPVVIQVGVSEEALAPFVQRRTIYLAVAGGVSLFILFFLCYIIAKARKQRQDETWLRTFVTNTPIVFYAMDPKGVFILSEGLGLKKLGLEAGEAVGHSAFEKYRDYPDILDAVRRATGGEAVFFEHKVGKVYLNNRLLPIADDNGRVIAVVGATVDITERVLAEQRLRENFEELTAIHEELTATHEELVATEEELRFQYGELHRSQKTALEIFNAAGDGLVVNDGETGEILAANRRVLELFGYSEEKFKQQGISLISTDANKEAALKVIRATVEEGPQPLYERDTHDSKGRRLILEISCTPVEIDGKTRCLASIRDITVRKQMEEGLEYLRQRDQMTGVYNRAYFEVDMMRASASKHCTVGIFVGDLDGLKLINDTLGHRQGDELLKRVAGLLAAGVKAPNYVARIGGDEFAIVLFDPDRQQMEELEQYYQMQVEAYNGDNPHLPLSLSLGWALGEEYVNVENVFKTADNNMYRQKMHQSQSVHGSIVRTLMKALEARDHITEGHADRLSRLMLLMGQSLEMPQEAISDLRLFAKFHDIGKVGIPDSILKKPGKLTTDEMNIMRQHCEIGFRIAKSSPDLEPIADWVLKHQEHWNGKGYPLGINGEEIPLPCRILGIVDAYDAMTSDRPYRMAMSSEDALAEIHRCSGTQFDPVLVEKFITMLRKEII